MKATPMLAAAGAATLMLAAAAVRMIAASDASFAGFPCPLDPALTCVMSGLDSPRGLAFGPEGALYVAEAGRGGANLENPEDGFCCFTGPFGGMLSYGRTGAISRFWDGHQEQIATGLPSIAMPNGNRGTGPNDISFLGRGDAYVTIGLENDPAFRDTLAAQHPEFPELARFGHLVHVAASGEWRFGADIAAYEALHNPDGRLRDDGTPFFDSNPYGILAEPGGHVVTDAGGNSLLHVDSSGLISLLAVFHSRGSDPARPSFAPEPFDQFTDAVPTSVVVGPDGAYYVGELTGVPFVDATANICRVVPGVAPRLFLMSDACVPLHAEGLPLSGFKMIIDMDFDAARNLYVLQHSTGAIQGTAPGRSSGSNQIDPNPTCATSIGRGPVQMLSQGSRGRLPSSSVRMARCTSRFEALVLVPAKLSGSSPDAAAVPESDRQASRSPVADHLLCSAVVGAA